MPILVVITGPIGAGKSSVALALANRLSEQGRSAAVVDLDDTVATLHAPTEDAEQTWDIARAIHGRLVGEWLAAGVDVVIAHGPFYSRAEDAALMSRVPALSARRRVMILATYEVALERVASDPSRGLSKDPAFLRSAFFDLLPDIAPCEWTFDSTKCSLGDVVATIADTLQRIEDPDPPEGQ